MGTKSAIWLCLVLAATGVVTALRLSNLTRERLVDGKVTAATMVADLFAASVAPALDFEDRESLAQEAAKLGTNPEIVYAAVFLPGSPAPVTEWLPDRAGRHASAPTRPNTEIFSDHIDVSRVLSAQDGHPLGGLVLRVSLAHENERLAEARKRIFEYTGGVTFLVVLGLLVITRRIVTKPLRDLALATHGLEQGRAEPVAVRANDEVGQLGGAFNAMAAAIVDREARLAEVNRELMQLLDGMRQAILVFEPGGVLGAAKSHEAEVIFDERDVEGLKVQELLYGTAVADVGAAAFEEWIAVAFTVPPDAWADVAELAPKDVTLETPSGERTLSLDFRPIEVGGRITRIMLLATDETEKRRLERTVKEQDEEHEKQMGAMRRLVAGGGQLLVSVLDRARDRIAACEDVLRTGGALDAPTIEQLFQHVHSVKGEARAFDLSVLEKAAAELEDFLAILRGRLREGQRPSLDGVGRDLRARLSSAREAVSRAGELLVQASPIGEAILHQVTVQREDVEALVRAGGNRRDELGALVNRLASRPFGELLLGLAEAVPRWAAREGKRARIEAVGRKVPIPAALARVLPDVLAHLVRNSLAHGIETVEDRAAAGKDELSVIRVAALEGPEGPSISVEDDGRGFDSGRILGRARALGLAESDVGFLVCVSGLSTAERSDLAGHGVGLAAVRSDLESVGYSMSLHSSENGLRIDMSPHEARPRTASSL